MVASVVDRYEGPKVCLEAETRAEVPSGDAMAWWLNLKAVCETEIEAFARGLTPSIILESLRSPEYYPYLLRSWSNSFSMRILDSGSMDIGPPVLYNFVTGPYHGLFASLVMIGFVFFVARRSAVMSQSLRHSKLLLNFGMSLLISSGVSSLILTVMSPLDTARIVFHSNLLLIFSFVLFVSIIVEAAKDYLRNVRRN